MFDIDMRGRIPIYEQLKDQTRKYIRLGILGPDMKMPSIRSLSAELNVNVNTVKRAFQELENEGVIYSVPGKGSFVSPTALQNTASAERALASLEEQLVSAKHKGVAKEELMKLIEKVYREGNI